MSTFLHYVHCKDALLDCSAPGGERCESLTWVDEIESALTHPAVYKIVRVSFKVVLNVDHFVPYIETIWRHSKWLTTCREISRYVEYYFWHITDSLHFNKPQSDDCIAGRKPRFLVALAEVQIVATLYALSERPEISVSGISGYMEFAWKQNAWSSLVFNILES